MIPSLCYFDLTARLLSCSKFRTLEEILTIEIKPGWKRGTKITFPEKGNEEPGVIPADVIFVIEEKPHATYKRDGNDLVVNQEITLLEALTARLLSCSKFRTLEEILTIEIKPGWKRGTKITFPEKGNEEPGVIPADVIFVIEEKPHATYKRDGNDLVVNQEITLLEALTGRTLDLTTLDGRSLMIPLTEIVKPGAEIVVPNEGMPISKEAGRKGNLRIKLDVKYPSRLTTEQKSELRRVLASVS
ncbi:hypothetical protein GOBAR_AA20049 [Gossypium barbadense]|uniref:Chaperone DnaJ C-terminal domain-containing protein n=1 Tax=Gossypium barbadense TaxID=3634 RepID=A0A2P5XBA8_GOSBA|nr:hypothetical protein GOBAR_AA20049 [Gossypium barbadense]